MALELTWEDPGPTTRNNSSIITDQLIAELKKHPNEWAVVHFSHRPDTGATWNRRYKKDGLEFTSRKQSEEDEPDDMKRYKVYARYVPVQTPPEVD